MSSKNKVVQEDSEKQKKSALHFSADEGKTLQSEPSGSTTESPNDSNSNGKKEEAPSLEKQLLEAKTEIQNLQNKMAEMNDQFLRKNAELDNFRKRLIRDKEESVKYANTSILTDLMETLDNFERAIEGGKTSDVESFAKGVSMIQSQLLSMLAGKYGLKQMKTIGEEFNPDLHEAISMVASEEHKETQVVLEEVQKGYILADRVLRHAKVVVSKVEE